MVNRLIEKFSIFIFSEALEGRTSRLERNRYASRGVHLPRHIGALICWIELSIAARPIELSCAIALIVMAQKRLGNTLNPESQRVAVWAVFAHRTDACHIVTSGAGLFHAGIASVVFTPSTAIPLPVAIVPGRAVRRPAIASPDEFCPPGIHVIVTDQGITRAADTHFHRIIAAPISSDGPDTTYIVVRTACLLHTSLPGILFVMAAAAPIGSVNRHSHCQEQNRDYRRFHEILLPELMTALIL